MFIVCFFFNFVFVMIANRISPGIVITDYENVVNIGADLMYAFFIGLFNSLIVPICIALNVVPTIRKIIIFVSIISFGSYIIISLIDYGIKVSAFYGVIIAGLIVSLGSIVTNLLFRQKYIR
jgi:hypothetical protein